MRVMFARMMFVRMVCENDCGCLHRTGMLEVYNRVKTIIVFTDVIG